MPSTKPGVQERILLHLLDYSDYKNSVEVPFSLSQMGIANAVAIARSNVPRAIAGLKDQGLLIERQAHVKGVSRKRKAYFLTESGKTLAEDTWNDVTVDKMTGDRIILEDVIASYSDNDSEAGIMLENEVGHMLEEAGGGMPADLDFGVDENASFTVS